MNGLLEIILQERKNDPLPVIPTVSASRIEDRFLWRPAVDEVHTLLRAFEKVSELPGPGEQPPPKQVLPQVPKELWSSELLEA